ncbi:YcdB/YcdC domain-containing protein [Paenibacillus crassostreae]|uniref:YcdB/YcdC repeated domain-containing protein n=1 Tax=Paenibacillus crassostreae TaxID=1763538 RepID=A0A167FRL7_9BACL|nr:YcdB/YcdC domain-containing protein [Paenibacillus crassostreae]AOZ94132.1 hypothetical protein LPB68_19355 [Paenibacillus crassostreae]OAB76832.1 hypothetical protein PNBC_05385 [Paenibacillus crassostreae]
MDIIDHEYLRKTAESIVDIPNHYQMMVEDNTPKGIEKERSFIWEDPEDDDNSIEISLDLETAQLIRLRIEKSTKLDSVMENGYAYTLEEAKEKADGFLNQYAPDHASYTWVHFGKRGDDRVITYREEVGRLPLPNTGGTLWLDSYCNVIYYRLEESSCNIAEKPEWSLSIVSAESVKKRILDDLHMQLVFVLIYPSIYEVEFSEPEYRLVYEPILGHRFIDAISGEDLYGEEHYVMPSSHPIFPATHVNNDTVEGDMLDNVELERLFDIDTMVYTLKIQKDDGERIRFMYKLNSEDDKDLEKLDRNDLSIDSYIQHKWGDKHWIFSKSFLIDVEKSTNRLSGYHRTDKNEHSYPLLSRAQCWERAKRFLMKFFPDYHSYLQLEVDQIDLEEEPRLREFFYLPLYIKGIAVHLERVTISISTYTGEIMTYKGISYEMIQDLSQFSLPGNIITPEEAFERYADHVSVILEWADDCEKDPAGYRLLYKSKSAKADVPDQSIGLRYIDAVNGQLIWDKIIGK